MVFENVRKVLACRTPVLGCHVWECEDCGHVKLMPHSCKSRLCPTCGKHATDVWADRVLNALLDVPYHHLIVAIPWQLRTLIAMNRREGLNLLVRAATESVQQWARDVKGMRMGILVVIHTFGSDMKWHPHIHLVVTGGGLSLDGARWVATDPRFLMHHGGLKKRWKYQVVTRMKEAHKEGKWRFPESASYLKLFPCFAAMLNKLWKLTWWAYIGASLAAPRFSVQYIGRRIAKGQGFRGTGKGAPLQPCARLRRMPLCPFPYPLDPSVTDTLVSSAVVGRAGTLSRPGLLSVNVRRHSQMLSNSLLGLTDRWSTPALGPSHAPTAPSL